MSALSLVVPLYKSEPNLERLFHELGKLSNRVPIAFEVVFVIDGSPDDCARILVDAAPKLPFASRVIHLSRNFGAFAAISAGLKHGDGDYFAVLAADLQEPPDLALQFLTLMQSGQADVVFGVRRRREDPWLSGAASRLFWAAYRRFLNPDMPRGGVDVFGCTRVVRDHVVSLTEADTSLISLLFWLGFRRAFVNYDRAPRREGKSAWTFGKKVRYALDTIFNFTDLPIRLLLFSGGLGVITSLVIGAIILFARLAGLIQVPGYTPIVLSIFFFGGLTTLGLGAIGQYVWLCLRNARRRPPFIVSGIDQYEPPGSSN
jgi:glycosyltransferase involved in cell wall biosynthesis